MATEESAVRGSKRRRGRRPAPDECYSQTPGEITELVPTRALRRSGTPAGGVRALAYGSSNNGSRPRDVEATRVLLQRARRGDPRAEDQLVRRFLPIMLTWAHGRLPRQLRPVDDTETLVHDTIRAGLKQLNTFKYRWDGCFLAYLRRIFMHKLVDHCRRPSPRRDRLPFDIPGNGDPSKQLEWEEFWAIYEQALETLPERMQQAVFLRLELDWQFAQIAECIGSPSANAARMYVTRGIRRLAKEMNHAGY